MKRLLRDRVVLWLASAVFFGMLLVSKPAFAASAPGKVKNVKAEALRNAVCLTWKPVKKADGYKIVVRRNGKKVKSVSAAASSSSKTVSHTVSKLKSGTEYTFRVRAFRKTKKGKKYGKYSETVTASTLADRLGKPAFRLKSFRGGAAVLEWDAVEGAQRYELYQRDESGKYKLIKKTKRLKHRVKNLSVGKTYNFKLYAAASAGNQTLRSKAAKLKAREYTEEEMRKTAASINDSNVNNSGIYDASLVISTQEAESYANYGNDGKAFSSLNNYLVWVNLYSQKTFLFERENASSPWTLMWQSPCITGKMGSCTPYGIYKFSWASPIHYYSEKDKRYAQYLSFFVGSSWSVHTFMYPDNNEYEEHPETFKEGFMASEGCVRLPRKYAKSIFNCCLNTVGDVIKVTETGSAIIVH